MKLDDREAGGSGWHSDPASSPHPEDHGFTPRTPLRAPASAVRAGDMTGGHVGSWIAVFPDPRSAPTFTALVEHVDQCGAHVNVYTSLPATAVRVGEEERCWTVRADALVTTLDATDLVPLREWAQHWYCPDDSRRPEADAAPTAPRGGLAVVR